MYLAPLRVKRKIQNLRIKIRMQLQKQKRNKNEADGHNAKPPPTDMQLMRTDNAPTKLAPTTSGPPGGMIGPPGPPTGNKFSAGDFLRKEGSLTFLRIHN